jgi:hypothetical protein
MERKDPTIVEHEMLKKNAKQSGSAPGQAPNGTLAKTKSARQMLLRSEVNPEATQPHETKPNPIGPKPPMGQHKPTQPTTLDWTGRAVKGACST